MVPGYTDFRGVQRPERREQRPLLNVPVAVLALLNFAASFLGTTFAQWLIR